ncbi:Helix-turn-helix domain-containing protein [Rhizobiales bacterium GAS188]|nr:Helix-turn-helix domain-containing protein [Rhizobiales bacterium GAS188]
MAGQHSFAELGVRMKPEAAPKAEAEPPRLVEAMDLAEVRVALNLSKEEIAQTLEIEQAWVAKVEKRADMYVSTLRRFIAAMGGELEIVARFADHSTKIKIFAESRLSTRARDVLRELLGPDADLDRPEIVAQATEAGLKEILGCGVALRREIRQWLSAREAALAHLAGSAPADHSRPPGNEARPS